MRRVSLISFPVCDAIVSPSHQLPLASISQKISLLLDLALFVYEQNEFTHRYKKLHFTAT